MNPKSELLGLARASWRLGDHAARLYVRQLQRAERDLLRLLSSRLDAIGAEDQRRPATALTAGAPPVPSPARTMESLLERALEQSGADGRRALFHRLVADLLPDEARILSALSEGPGAAVVNVENRALAQPTRMLEHASTIGSTAGLAVPDMAARYITHLLALGLVQLGPEAPELAREYEILVASRPVREALGRGGPIAVPARVVRRTMTLTELGRELWGMCQAADDA